MKAEEIEMFSFSPKIVFVLLCIITFLVPFEELLEIPESATGIFLTAAVALAVSFFAVLTGLRQRKLPSALILLAVFILWCIVSLYWTVDPEQTVQSSFTYISLLLLTWMIFQFVRSQRQLSWILHSYLFGCCVSLVMLFVSYIEGRLLFLAADFRYTGGGLNPNSLALLLDIAVIIAVYLTVEATSKWKKAYWIFVSAACIGVFLTGSRAGTLALIAAVLTSLLIARPKTWKSTLLPVMAVAFVIWLVTTIVPIELLERVTEGREAGTYIVRQAQWNAGIEVWHEAPVMGIGAGAFITAVTGIGARALVAHNTFLQILTENGIVGMGLMIVTWGLLIRMVLQLPRGGKLFWLGIGCVWMLGAMAGSHEYHKITWLLYAWLMVQSAIYRTGEKDKCLVSYQTSDNPKSCL